MSHLLSLHLKNKNIERKIGRHILHSTGSVLKISELDLVWATNQLVCCLIHRSSILNFWRASLLFFFKSLHYFTVESAQHGNFSASLPKLSLPFLLRVILRNVKRWLRVALVWITVNTLSSCTHCPFVCLFWSHVYSNPESTS